MTHPSASEIEGFVTGLGGAESLITHLASCDACATATRRAARAEVALHDAGDGAAFCAACACVATGERCGSCGAAVRVRDYRVERLLAAGPLGRVYAARDSSGAQVALKELSFAGPRGTDALAAFEREARVLERLAHAGIPRFVDSFTEGRGAEARAYLVQELIVGESLAERLAHTQLAEPEIIEIARQVLDVLTYLQSLSPMVFHRDVKPANLLRRPDGTIALVDFGAARDLGSTAGATIVGTFGYMPVEQLAGVVDATTDLHALGSTLWHLATRIEPWRLWADPLLLRRSNVSPALRRFLERMVAREPRRRFADARAARAAIDALGTARWVPRSAWWAAAAGLLLTGSIGGLGAALLHRGSPATTSATAATTLSAAGYVAAAYPMTASADVSGPLGALRVKVGDVVTTGQTIVEVGSWDRLEQVRMAETKLKATEEILRQARTNGERKIAAVNLNLAEAELERAKIALEHSTVRAPGAGTVIEVLKHVTEQVTAGQPIAHIANLQEMNVELDVEEGMVSRLKVGQTATIVTDSPEGRYHGRITLIGQEIDRTKGTARVLVYFADPDDKLRPGMSVRVTFD